MENESQTQSQTEAQTAQIAPIATSIAEMTPQGVGMRFVATLIDAFILYIVGAVIGMFSGTGGAGGFVLTGWSALLFFVIAIAYYIVLESKMGGTLGKKVLKMRVVMEDGKPCTMTAAVIRTLMRFIDGLFGYLVAAIAVWSSKKKQRFGDMVAHTLVVK